MKLPLPRLTKVYGPEAPPREGFDVTPEGCFGRQIIHGRED